MPARVHRCTIQALEWAIRTTIRSMGMARRSVTGLTTTTHLEPMSPREVWIGLAQVAQRPGARVLMDRNLAYANVLALASDPAEFAQAVRHAAAELGFDLLELEECEPMRLRLQVAEVANELVELSGDVGRTGSVRFSTLHTWVSEE